MLRDGALDALIRCEDGKLRGRIGPDVDCAVGLVAGLDERAARKVARACGGRDRRCGTGDDQDLAAVGWDVAVCPGIVGADPARCRQPIADCGDVAACLACTAAEAAGGAGSYYDALAPSAGDAALRCQRAVGRAAAKLLRASSEKSRKRAFAAVCKACGGRDRRCDGTDDVAPDAIAFGSECPAAAGPNGRTCGGALAGPEDVAACAECLAAARLDCVAESIAPSGDPQPEECTACCGPRRMILESVAGGSFAFGALVPFELPAGIRLTIDVGPADEGCRHDVTIPPDGLDVPPFCLGAFPYTADLLPTGCPIGGALGRGTLWDGRSLAAEADLTVAGDTSDGLCNPPAQECSLQELEAGFNFLGRVTATAAASAARGLHLRLDLPARTIAWEDVDGQCPDADGIHGEGDQTVTDDRQLAHLTTGMSSVGFTDLDGDGCAYTGLGPGTSVVRPGTPATGPCCTPGQRLTLVATSPVFTGAGPFGDLLTSLSIPFEVVACEPWPGPPAATCDVLEGGGRAVTKLAAMADDPAAVVVQADGAVVAAGHSHDGKAGEALALVRHLADGTLDPGFGPAGDGRVRAVIGHDARALALAVQDDAKLVVAGHSSPIDGAPLDVLLARFLADGSPDPLLDGDGSVVVPLSAGDDRASAVAVDGLGRILVAGRTSNGTDDDAFVARFLSTGALDPDFGTGGVATIDLGGSTDFATGLAVQSDGRPVVAVRVGEYPEPRGAVVLRLLEDGSPDPDFGTAGIASLGAPSADYWLNDVALQSDGRIVVGGTAALPDAARFLLGRLLADGMPDPAFGDGGFAPLDLAPRDDARAVVVLDDGTIAMAGWAETGAAPFYDHDFVVARYTSAGLLDASFGDGGIALTDFGGAGDEANALAATADGRLVAAGVYRPQLFSYEFSFALARHRTDGRPDPTFNGECAWR